MNNSFADGEYPPSQRPASFSIEQIRADADWQIEQKMKQNKQ